MRREQQHLLYELERELDRRLQEDEQMDELAIEVFWQSTVTNQIPGDPMELFGKWLERYEETHGEHDGWYADLVNLWANEERGEQETLCLSLSE